MAYAPAAVVLAFTAPRIGGPAATRIAVAILTSASLALSLLALPQLARPSIPVESYPEVRVSGDAVAVHEGRFFTLWRADTAPPWYPLARPP